MKNVLTASLIAHRKALANAARRHHPKRQIGWRGGKLYFLDTREEIRHLNGKDVPHLPKLGNVRGAIGFDAAERLMAQSGGTIPPIPSREERRQILHKANKRRKQNKQRDLASKSKSYKWITGEEAGDLLEAQGFRSVPYADGRIFFL